jgi:hypothetical protein
MEDALIELILFADLVFVVLVLLILAKRGYYIFGSIDYCVTGQHFVFRSVDFWVACHKKKDRCPFIVARKRKLWLSHSSSTIMSASAGGGFFCNAHALAMAGAISRPCYPSGFYFQCAGSPVLANSMPGLRLLMFLTKLGKNSFRPGTVRYKTLPLRRLPK